MFSTKVPAGLMPDVACRWSPSCCVLTCSFLCVQTWRERETQRWPALVSYKSRVSPCPPPQKNQPGVMEEAGKVGLRPG